MKPRHSDDLDRKPIRILHKNPLTKGVCSPQAAISVSSSSPFPTLREIPVQHMASFHAEGSESGTVDYAQRAHWLRAAVLGANDGLVSVASLMMGVGAVQTEVKAMLLAGLAGLVAGACSMAIGEFVSVSTQYDIQKAQMGRDARQNHPVGTVEKEKLPNPLLAAVASAVAFIVGGVVPLVAAAIIGDYKIRLAVASLTLAVFGAVEAVLGRTPVVISAGKSACRRMDGYGDHVWAHQANLLETTLNLRL